MASTPSDVVIEVLSWLPAKSLMRFKSVSKHWYSLILSRIFVELHQTRSYTRADGVNLVLPPRYYSLDYPFLVIKAAKSNPIGRPIIQKPCTPNWPDTITNIVNGLVCFYHQRYNGCIYVYNLTTREYLPLPPTRGATMCSFNLDNLRKCLLGFDPRNNEYKVVHFWATCNSWVQCEVFTIGEKYGTWRKINVSEFSKIWHVALSSLCLDGFVYWIWPFWRNHRIIAFNVEREKFDLIRYPPEELSGAFLTQYGGQFSLAGISTSSNDVEITLWRLMEWTDEEFPLWSKQVIVCPFSSGLGEIRCSHSGQAFLMRSSVSNGFIIESYDLETGESVEMELEKVEGILGLNYGFSPLKVVDNIIPLKNITAKGICKLSFLTCAREVGFPELNIASDN